MSDWVTKYYKRNTSTVSESFDYFRIQAKSKDSRSGCHEHARVEIQVLDYKDANLRDPYTHEGPQELASVLTGEAIEITKEEFNGVRIKKMR